MILCAKRFAPAGHILNYVTILTATDDSYTTAIYKYTLSHVCTYIVYSGSNFFIFSSLCWLCVCN